jgi:hypothetical protein
MVAERPQIADLAKRRVRQKSGQNIGRVVVGFGRVLKRFDPQIDLGHLETGNFKAEVETGQRKVLELLREQPVIPGGNLGEPVVGDHESAGLRPGEVIQTQRRHLGKAKRAAGRQPTMSGNRIELSIDQNRNIKAECRNAAGRADEFASCCADGR